MEKYTLTYTYRNAQTASLVDTHLKNDNPVQRSASKTQACTHILYTH